ncbi:MAG: flagellar type III secretion system protein FlhB [Rhodobacteraceae bacterium]|nr:flagellar type III secretion system protein FlhB [Paracoccaceae bacterium]MCW9042506.1 flagellar type III secretion system protein FlhB [Pseudopelagicola sp.]
MSEESHADKPHDPTQRKLDQARKKGEVVRSTDISAAASYGGLLIAFVVLGLSTVSSVFNVLFSFLDRTHNLAPMVFEGHPSAALAGVFREMLVAISPWFAIPFFLVLAGLFAQRAIVFAPDKLVLKVSRINPLENARQKYGRRGLFEFAKSFAKLVVFSLCLFLVTRGRLSEITGAMNGSPLQVAALMGQICVAFLVNVLLISSVIAGIDYLWQRQEFHLRNRMSYKELQDEAKEAEGDPHLKGERRRKAQAIASTQMMASVPEASVVIVNPTHFAVALKWTQTRDQAPVCVAKGVDETAHRIREIAQENGVPIHSDPPTARALFATVELEQEIQPEHYRAVAAAIRFAEAMRKKAGSRAI